MSKLNKNYKPIALVDTDGMANSDWLKWRTSGIGGSDVSSIYGINGWTTKRALYFAKIGLEKGDPSNPYTLDFGHCVEPFVASWFQANYESQYKKWLEKKLNKEIDTFNIYKDTFMYQHPLYPFMQANLDYRWRAKTTDGEIVEGIFECKTTSYHIAQNKWGYDKVPAEYELQCRHYMSIMNVNYTIIACAWGNNASDYAVGFIERNDESEEELIQMEKDFWENNVLARVAPEIDSTHGKQEYDAFVSYNIKDKISKGELKEITHNKQDVLAACFKVEQLQQDIKTLQEQQDALKSALMAERVKLLESLKDNDEASVSEGDNTFVVRNKKVVSSRLDQSGIKNNYPEIYDKYVKESISERFSVKRIVLD